MMKNRLDTQIAELRQEAGATEIPVNVIGIAQHLGLRVYEGSFSNPNISGMFFADPDRVPKTVKAGRAGTILVNSSEPEVRKRFTIAHEIGHFFLNHPREDVTTELYRGVGAPYDPLLEREANSFAARLLMPTEEFRKAFSGQSPLELISLSFGVSTTAAMYRAHSENLIEASMRNF